MEAEVDQQLGAEKSQRTDGRSGYRSGNRPRRLDTRMGTMYLMVPKVRQGGYIPFFVNRSLADTVYPVLRVDALCEKVRVDGRIVSMAVLIVRGVDENGRRDIIAHMM